MQSSRARLSRYLADYRPQLKKALKAIQTLESPNADEESFSQALADLHVCATVLEAASEGGTWLTPEGVQPHSSVRVVSPASKTGFIGWNGEMMR